MKKVILTLACAAPLFAACNLKNAQNPGDSKLYMVVGTYSSADEDGVHVFTFDEADAAVSPVVSVKGIANPSYLTVSANGQLIYAVSEEGKEEATVNALFFEKETGGLRVLNSVKLNEAAPCYVALHEDKQLVVTANYSGGSISVLPVDKSGRLQAVTQTLSFEGSSTNKERQTQSHVHCVMFSPDGDYLLATDLGTDKVYRFGLGADADLPLSGELPPVEVTPGYGPRHLCFHPNGKFVYLINELSGMITAFSYNAGKLAMLQTIRSDAKLSGGSADIHVSPDGNFLYASNRLFDDGIAIFNINGETGKLEHAGYQFTKVHPRNFVITPNGKYLLVACRDDNVIQVFLRNEETGMLMETNTQIKVNKPVCIKFF